MSSYLDFEGVYDPRLMFAVTNWSDEDFSIAWEHDVYTLKAGEVKVYPQYIAYYLTRNLVDREMYKEAAKLPNDTRERERAEMAVASKDMRKPYEDKTIQIVKEGEESPEVAALRRKIEAEVRGETLTPRGETLSNELTKEDEQEFADLTGPGAMPAPEVAPVQNETSDAAAGVTKSGRKTTAKA